MNAALLLMTSTFMAGADAPAAAAPAAAAVAGCSGCSDSCDPCASARPNLLDKLKGKFGKKKGCCEAACGGCDGCGAAPAPAPAGPAPKPMTPNKVGTEGAPAITIPSPGALLVPSVPVTPVSGGKLTGSTSPY